MISNMNKKTVLSLSVLGIIFLGAHYLVPQGDNEANVSVALEVVEESGPISPLVIKNPFSKINLGARSAYVFNTNTGEVIFKKDSDTQLPLASVTKVMTAYSALKRLPENTIIKIDYNALNEEGDTGLLVGEEWELDELVEFMLMVSSNDAARALADATALYENSLSFSNLINTDVIEIGLANTYFSNPSGLDTSKDLSGAFGTAEEVAKFFNFAIQKYPEVFSVTSKLEKEFISESGFIHKAENTNESVRDITGLVASKTGFTDLAGGNLVVAYDIGPGKRMVAVVLGSTVEERESDIKQLVNASIMHYVQ